MLEKEVYKKLGMRSSAESLFEKFSNASKIIMDFDNVEFMSRSFAQEYVYQKHKVDIEVEEKNMSEPVKEMYNIVYEDYKNHLSG